MVNIILDPDSAALQNHFAVVHAPRRSRKRFAESCVTLVADADAALAHADTAANRHAAVVYGPSVSSESQRIYYLVKWLDDVAGT
ncbi:MAG: hypothetical protein PVG66_13755 [Chromatiales bacterium]